MTQRVEHPIVSTEELAAMGGPNMVYVREVPAADVLADTPMRDVTVKEGAIWYAVHASDGSRLAVLDDRDTAFATARGHDLNPVSAH